jgi:hypothetical protein
LIADCPGQYLPHLPAVGLAGMPLHLLPRLLPQPAAPSCPSPHSPQLLAAAPHRRRWVLPLPLLLDVFLLLLKLLPLLVLLPLLFCLPLLAPQNRRPLLAASC